LIPVPGFPNSVPGFGCPSAGLAALAQGASGFGEALAAAGSAPWPDPHSLEGAEPVPSGCPAGKDPVRSQSEVLVMNFLLSVPQIRPAGFSGRAGVHRFRKGRPLQLPGPAGSFGGRGLIPEGNRLAVQRPGGGAGSLEPPASLSCSAKFSFVRLWCRTPIRKKIHGSNVHGESG
jgi:hypothetical protein